MEFDNTQSSRMRLLHAGKLLFAKHGYEQTSTAAIAREAGTSESQLVRYFRGKAGLLEAIFDESWTPLNTAIQSGVAASPNAKDALVGVLSTIIAAFSRDTDMAFILLFEGRRVRSGTEEILLSKGFQQFWQLLLTLIQRGCRDGTFDQTKINAAAVATSLLGAAEAMIRELMLAERTSQPRPFAEEDISRTFEAMLDGLCRK